MKKLFYLSLFLLFMLLLSEDAFAGYSYGYRFPYSDNPEQSTYYTDYLKSVSPKLAPKEKEELDKAIANPIIPPKEDHVIIDSISKHSLGAEIYGSALLPMLGYATVNKAGIPYSFSSISAGGGLGLRYKGNINKYFGIIFNISFDINYSMGLKELSVYKESYYLSYKVNTQLLLAFQRELPKGVAGFVPLFGIGLDFSTLLGYSYALNPQTIAILYRMPYSMPVTVAPGVVALLGFRYNFSNSIFLGIAASYTLNFAFQVAGSNYIPNNYTPLDRMLHNFKLSFEIGANF